MPPVMGVPSSSEDEEELLADHAGAPLGGAPPVAVDTTDVGVQTAHNVVIPAFDLVDVASQTDGKVAFSSFVGDTPQAALATAIRALSPGSLFRLDGALRQALAQPLVDVAPSLQGRSGNGARPARISTSSVPRLESSRPRRWASSTRALGRPPPGFSGKNKTPRRLPSRQRFDRCQTMTSTRRPLPSRLISRTRTLPPGRLLRLRRRGPSRPSSTSPGGKTPFRKAPPPALVVETPEVKVGKAPPVPYPDLQIAFLTETPKKPPVKRAPVQPQQAPPTAAAAIASTPAPSSSAASSSEPVVANTSAGALADTGTRGHSA